MTCPTAKTHPERRVFGIRRNVEGEGTCPTAQACHCGCVCDVRCVSNPRNTSGDVFLGFGKVGDTPNMEG